jgi:hypothetical protein
VSKQQKRLDTARVHTTQTIPAKRPVKAIYTKLLLELIDLLDPPLTPDQEDNE